ncbi:hypothetical protein BDA96_09G003300 [Sorghum bicolor]|uniref:Uncharacterized protein n=1 Tax=Sorghum bicolor TaxID=4558 RepID=A0A921Q6E8_SORBI|nr:hypothetical protein BDA96_09G003300 [Sorghum bicolor]
MGSVGVEAADDSSSSVVVKEFLQRCEPSGDAAYGELRALLERLHDPATRRDARLFLAALRRHQQQQISSSGGDPTHEEFFRRFGFRIQELLLQDPTTTDITASTFLSTNAAEVEKLIAPCLKEKMSATAICQMQIYTPVARALVVDGGVASSARLTTAYKRCPPCHFLSTSL